MNAKDPKQQAADLAAIRERLADSRGRHFWRSLQDLADSEAIQDYVRREFPDGAEDWADPMSRRSFLKLMGASLALAGLAACAPAPAEKIVPHVEPPDPRLAAGKPLYFATAMPLGGYGTGVLVESHQGRPTKIEGNPDHPASLGATDAFAQASLLDLYDPDRSQTALHLGQPSSWDDFLAAAAGRMQAARANGGAGLRILTETITSPTLGAQLRSLLQQFPAARWVVFDPVTPDGLREGMRLAFGADADAVYHFDRADRILSLDADFLFTFPGRVRYAREFGERRRVAIGPAGMNRLYVVESTPTITGAVADHRLPVRAAQVERLARVLAERLGLGAGPVDESRLTPEQLGWVDALARDLQAHRGASLVVPGLVQPPAVHALAHAMNGALGNLGATVDLIPPVEVQPGDRGQPLPELAADMRTGRVDALLVLGGNPAFTAPADLDFASALGNVGFSAHLSPYVDETSALASWHLPETHYLEAWSDIRAYNGVATIMQPLISPLYDGRSAHEFLAGLTGDARSGHQIVHDHWAAQNPSPDFERFWRRALHDGVVPDTEARPISASLNPGLGTALPAPAPDEGMEIVFRPDPSVWDGRFVNNGWLQELPKPLTTLTWDNPALIGPATAERLGLASEDLVELRLGGRSLTAAVWVMPGHADDSLTLYLGYGQARAGRVGEGLGFNAYRLRTSDRPGFRAGLEVRKLGGTYPLAATQMHFRLEDRDLLRAGTLDQFLANPNFAQREFDLGPPPSLYPEPESKGYAWGMAIDLSACTGCNACIVACQAENNIPIVGKEGVRRSREMHWLKIDVYHEGDPARPAASVQPRLCMHCETAPCEVVCPVAATVHDSEGLNEMIYNRCVGTRYCSNNCPYKVRRFNFFDYNRDLPLANLVRNPEVTVRSRGVMEKCTYNVQRIEAARLDARNEGRTIRDGEIQTACQQACPSQAIVFGDINDPESRVSRLKASPLNYGMLAELGTRPRTTYLAKLRNPNPETET